MKTLNVFRKVFFAIGAVAMAVGVAGTSVLALNADLGALAVSSGFSVLFLGSLMLILGLLLDSSKNEVAHKTGIGLHVTAVVLFLTYVLFFFVGPAKNPILYQENYEFYILIAGLVVYAFGWFITLLMHASRRYDCGCAGRAIQPEEDAHIAAIMKWKKLYNEGIITEREFIDKRNEILGLRK